MNNDQTVISDTIIQAFISQRVRATADQWSRSYSDAKRMLLEWEIKGYATKIPDDPNIQIPVLFGTVEPISGQEAHDIIRVCQIVIAFCENENPVFGDRKPLNAIVKVAANGAYS